MDDHKTLLVNETYGLGLTCVQQNRPYLSLINFLHDQLTKIHYLSVSGMYWFRVGVCVYVCTLFGFVRFGFLAYHPLQVI